MKSESRKSAKYDGPVNSVWLPFASSKVVEIELSCYDAASGGRPVTSYPVHEVGPDLVRTVDSAAEVAYRLARDTKGGSGSSYCIGYRLKNMPATTRIEGESGGLAMALAIYCEFTNLQIGRVAATGRLTSLKEGGAIGRVDGLSAKLLGALELLQPGDTMFCPRENLADISMEIKAEYKEKNIFLLPVDSVYEALLHFKCGKKGTEIATSAPKKVKVLAATFLLALGCLLWTITSYNSPDTEQESIITLSDEQIAVVVETVSSEMAEEEQVTSIKSPEPEVLVKQDVSKPSEHQPPLPVFAKGFE